MAELDIPPKPTLSSQLLASAAVLVVVAIVIAIFAKLVVGLIIFLLGVVFGIGSQFIKDRPLDK